jgi:heme-degrading monooxygenase HmoA
MAGFKVRRPAGHVRGTDAVRELFLVSWLVVIVMLTLATLAAGPRRCRGRAAAGMIGPMTVVKINAITVPADSGDELARRFAARAGAVDDQDGFEGFELLKPADKRTTWLVVTRWRDEAAFQAWLHSPAFGHGHRSAAERAGGAAPPPVGTDSELWSYEIAGGSGG